MRQRGYLRLGIVPLVGEPPGGGGDSRDAGPAPARARRREPRVLLLQALRRRARPAYLHVRVEERRAVVHDPFQHLPGEQGNNVTSLMPEEATER